MQIQITPQYVNPPKNPQGKWGNVKDAQGNVFWVPVSYLPNFQIGQPVNISHQMSPRPWGNLGHVQQITHINGLAVTGQQGPVQGGDRPAATPQNVPQSDKEEGMFIMGVVGRAMGSGQFGMDDILHLTQRTALAWRKRHEQSAGVSDGSYGLEPPQGDPNAPPDHDPREEPPFP